MTYLDDEVMIVRDESGVPDVLVKKFSAPAPPTMEAEEIVANATATNALSDEDRALLDAAESEAS